MGARVVLVHMGDDALFEPMLKQYGLGDVSVISDASRRLYATFGLERGKVMSLLGPSVWGRGLKACLSGHRPRKPVGDVWQMPGVFLLKHGTVLNAFRSKTIADKPDFESFVRAGINVKLDS